jgi:hypothetical protein
MVVPTPRLRAPPALHAEPVHLLRRPSSARLPPSSPPLPPSFPPPTHSSSRSSLHYDPYQNLLAVVAGSKRVTLFSPEATPAMYPRSVGGGTCWVGCAGAPASPCCFSPQPLLTRRHDPPLCPAPPHPLTRPSPAAWGVPQPQHRQHWRALRRGAPAVQVGRPGPPRPLGLAHRVACRPAAPPRSATRSADALPPARPPPRAAAAPPASRWGRRWW